MTGPARRTVRLARAETRSISIAASPADVFAFVADAYNLPRWAPAFAAAVRRDGENWTVTSGDAEFTIAVRSSPECGTVDLVSAINPNLGAFTRVLPNTDGSEYLFTLFFPEGTPERDVAAQMATVEEEVRAVRRFAENTVE